jgi:hypothetical protein
MYPSVLHTVFLIFLFHINRVLGILPWMQVERVAIQWVNYDHKLIHKRPSLESYAISVVNFPDHKLPIRMTCGARLFDFNKDNINGSLDEYIDQRDKINLIDRARKISSLIFSIETNNHTRTLLLNETNNKGRTSTFLETETINTCHLYDIGTPKYTSSWHYNENSPTNRVNQINQLLPLLHSENEMFASIAFDESFLEEQATSKILSDPYKPIESEVGNVVSPVVEGALKPVVKDMGEAVVADASGQVETLVSEEAAGDQNDQMLRELVPGLTMTLVENLAPTLSQVFPDTLSEALSESMREKLTSLLVGSLRPKLVLSLTTSLLQPINLWTTATVSHTVERGLTRVLSNMLTKSLAHAIVPSLIHTLSHDATQDYYAYMCYNHKTYCQYTSYAPSQVFYASYYASYYSAAAGSG